ncbi:Uncharacterized 30.6 kDa protein in fumA 3'region (ORF2) [Durusdinium trenchii]|uniref:Uncharacterized 30.6 kDa protein in fumA 3'region (ORF2) n=1 Tax=Durusdinium trenchii TaxID=1381693 RepID=A0ABP0LCR5_9DINO
MCFKICKFCCRGLLLLVPVVLAWLWSGFLEPPELVRTVGQSEFARPENYGKSFVVTEEHRKEFFRDGATLLKGVLRPEVVEKLHKLILAKADAGYFNMTTAFNMWMDSDELLDFYLFGPLGGIAAQFFSSPESVTSHLPPSAQLQRDFLSRRHQNNVTNGWHIDRTECQGGDQPSKYTSTALPRLAVPLAFKQGVRGTQILNQSQYAAAMREEDFQLYWAGKSPYRREGRFEPWFGYDYNTSLPVLPGVELKKDMIMEPWMDPGDVVIFNTCLWHRSPPWTGPEVEFALQPTFAPSSHVPKDPPILMDSGGGWCDHGLGEKSIGHVALTIDDGLCRSGAGRSMVTEVRELLKEHGAQATFFLCSDYVEDLEAEAKQLLEDGHEFANHCPKDGVDYYNMPPVEFETELLKTSSKIQELTGANPYWFRAPQGKYSGQMHGYVSKHGMQHALGDCYCDDWAIEDSQWVAGTMLQQARGGSVMIVHMPEKGFREHIFKVSIYEV